MNTIEHHLPEEMLAAYAAGTLPDAYALTRKEAIDDLRNLGILA